MCMVMNIITSFVVMFIANKHFLYDYCLMTDTYSLIVDIITDSLFDDDRVGIHCYIQ